MADSSILDPAVHAAPKSYLIKGAQQLVLKTVTASFDGTGAGSSWIPAVQVLDPSGFVTGTYVLGNSLSVGATADVTWFPGLGSGGGSVAESGQFDIKVFSDTSPLLAINNAFVFAVPSDLNATNLTDAQAYVSTVSTSGTPTCTIKNNTTGNTMLSTAITIDANEFTSYTAATPPVINPSFKTVSTGDLIAINVSVIGTGALGLGVILTFGL